MSGWTHDPRTSAAKLAAYTNPEMGVAVGVLPNAQDYDEETSQALSGYTSKVVMVATYHELNPRSRYNQWLFKSIKAGEGSMTRDMVKTLKRAGNDKAKRRRLMAEFGDRLAESVQSVILHRGASLPANRESTLEFKQGSVPMVDTSHLISVIDSEVYVDA